MSPTPIAGDAALKWKSILPANSGSVEMLLLVLPWAEHVPCRPLPLALKASLFMKVEFLLIAAAPGLCQFPTKTVALLRISRYS